MDPGSETLTIDQDYSDLIIWCKTDAECPKFWKCGNDGHCLSWLYWWKMCHNAMGGASHVCDRFWLMNICHTALYLNPLCVCFIFEYINCWLWRHWEPSWRSWAGHELVQLQCQAEDWDVRNEVLGPDASVSLKLCKSKRVRNKTSVLLIIQATCQFLLNTEKCWTWRCEVN